MTTQEPMTAEKLAEVVIEDMKDRAYLRTEPYSHSMLIFDSDDTAFHKAEEAIVEAINQAREADKRKIEDLEACLRNTQGIFNESLKVNINRSTQIEELESKVLELTEALKFYAFQSQWEQDHPGEWENRMSNTWGEKALEALSTTPDTVIRERIKGEGFNEGVEACQKEAELVLNLYRASYGNGPAREILNRIQSIKKEGK